MLPILFVNFNPYYSLLNINEGMDGVSSDYDLVYFKEKFMILEMLC